MTQIPYLYAALIYIILSVICIAIIGRSIWRKTRSLDWTRAAVAFSLLVALGFLFLIP